AEQKAHRVLLAVKNLVRRAVAVAPDLGKYRGNRADRQATQGHPRVERLRQAPEQPFALAEQFQKRGSQRARAKAEEHKPGHLGEVREFDIREDIKLDIDL